MNRTDNTGLHWKLKFVRYLIQIWPFSRGKVRIGKLFMARNVSWPDYTTFNFRYGTFVNAPMAPWPLGYRELFLYGEMEVKEVRIWRKILGEGDIVVDAGANYGYWSLVASSMVGVNGQVHAFEPAPDTYKRLAENIRISGATNVQCHQAGLSDKEARYGLYISKNDPIGGWASLRQRTDCKFSHCVEVKTSALSEIFTDSASIRLIKLDIEGAELTALTGAAALLASQKPPLITFEWNRTTADAFGYKPEAIGDYLSKFGYTLFLANPKGGLIPFEDRSNKTGLGWGWIPMGWALTAQHQREMGLY